MIFEKVKKIAVNQMRIKDDSIITLDANFKSDLKADSLDLAEMLMTIEEEFNIEIPTDRAMAVKTVGEFVALVEELV